MSEENKIHLLKGNYTVKIEGDRALFFVEGEEKPIENYAVGEVTVDEKKEKYYPVPNPNDELGLFHNKTHDFLEELLKGRADGLLNSLFPFTDGLKTPIKLLNEDLGYKMRKDFIQKIDGLKECFALYIQTDHGDRFLFTDGSYIGGYQSQVQTFSTIEEAEERKQYYVSEFNRINALYKKFQEELKEKGVDEDSHEASEICDASEFGKEFEKIKINSFLMKCTDMEFIAGNHGFRNGECIHIAQVMRKGNGDVFNI